MATQKKKRTQRKRDQRRAHWKVVVPEISSCPNCGEAVAPYHLCHACGQYKGRQVLELAQEAQQ